MTTRAPRLLVRELSKSYGAVAAVRSVSLEVGPGEIFGLVGANGAGKTTLLECILGLRPADSGRILVNGIDAVRRPAAARQRVGAQLQTMELPAAITAREALELFAAFYSNPWPAETLLERFGLGDKADAQFAALSGGQRQRLGLALAWINRPRLVVLDEPTSGLDPAARLDLREMILAARSDGSAILLSTHDLEEAQQLCDRVGILAAGQLIATGPTAELVSRSGATRRIYFEPRNPVPAERLGELAGVIDCRRAGDGWYVRSHDLNQTTAALAAWMQEARNELRELRIQAPTLEDAFFELTGPVRREASP